MPSEKDREESRAGERPVEVTDENRPPGDPGANVDIQEYVGGQPGRPDPGVTGGPSHDEIDAAEDASREPQPDPGAGDHVRAGVARNRAREREWEREAAREDAAAHEPEAHEHAGGPSGTREEGTEFERQFREKTARTWPEREND